jgi:hypothetical protein
VVDVVVDDAVEENEYDDEAEEEDEQEEEPRARRPGRGRRGLTSQRVVIVGSGIGFAAVVVALVLSSTSSRSGGCSCGDQYRGPGANQQLAAALPSVAGRFARGFTADGQIAHGNLAAGGTARLTERVEGGRCYVWIGLSPDGTDLDLILAENGSPVSEDQANDNFPVVQHCVADDTTLTLDAKMYTGAADWVIQRYALAGRRGADQVELLHEMHSKRILANDVEPVSELERFRLRSGEEKAISLTADADWCYVPLAVSSPGTDLDMFLVDPDNRVVEQDQARDNFPMVRHCPTKGGTYTIRLLMYGGDGDVAFRLYRGKLGAAGLRSGGSVGGIGTKK